MSSRIGYVVVFAVAFLLLLVTFRSIVIPIKAIALNALSVSAALGIVTYVFQDGHFEDLLNFESTSDAVNHGIKSTASVVTAAAVVMVAVFGIFATLSFIDMKQFGVGLAAAVLIDATLVRGVLLPATMKLLGDWNWYLPKWLEWLPEGPALERGPEPQEPPRRPRRPEVQPSEA
jgi:RND superfamily putative drug exporter